MSFSNNSKSAQYSQENRNDGSNEKEHQFNQQAINEMDTRTKHSKRNSQFNRFQSIFYIPPQLQLLTQKAQQKLLSKPNPESSMSTSRRESIQKRRSKRLSQYADMFEIPEETSSQLQLPSKSQLDSSIDFSSYSTALQTPTLPTSHSQEPTFSSSKSHPVSPTNPNEPNQPTTFFEPGPHVTPYYQTLHKKTSNNSSLLSHKTSQGFSYDSVDNTSSEVLTHPEFPPGFEQIPIFPKLTPKPLKNNHRISTPIQQQSSSQTDNLPQPKAFHRRAHSEWTPEERKAKRISIAVSIQKKEKEPLPPLPNENPKSRRESRIKSYHSTVSSDQANKPLPITPPEISTKEDHAHRHSERKSSSTSQKIKDHITNLDDVGSLDTFQKSTQSETFKKVQQRNSEEFGKHRSVYRNSIFMAPQSAQLEAPEGFYHSADSEIANNFKQKFNKGTSKQQLFTNDKLFSPSENPKPTGLSHDYEMEHSRVASDSRKSSYRSSIDNTAFNLIDTNKKGSNLNTSELGHSYQTETIQKHISSDTKYDYSSTNSSLEVHGKLKNPNKNKDQPLSTYTQNHQSKTANPSGRSNQVKKKPRVFFHNQHKRTIFSTKPYFPGHSIKQKLQKDLPLQSDLMIDSQNEEFRNKSNSLSAELLQNIPQKAHLDQNVQNSLKPQKFSFITSTYIQNSKEENSNFNQSWARNEKGSSTPVSFGAMKYTKDFSSPVDLKISHSNSQGKALEDELNYMHGNSAHNCKQLSD